MGSSCYIVQPDFPGFSEQVFSADTTIAGFRPDTGIHGSLRNSPAAIHTIRPVSDSIRMQLRAKKSFLLQARQDSIVREKLKQDLPVYAVSGEAVPVFALPANKAGEGQWTPGIAIHEPVKGMEARQLIKEFPDWTFLFWLGSLAILLLAKKSFSRYFNQVINSLYDFNLSMNLFKDRNILLMRVSSLLQANFLLVSGLFLYLYFPFFPGRFHELSTGVRLLLSFGIPAFLIFGRYLLNSILGFLFSREKVFSQYNFHIQQSYKFLGIILLPIVILELYFNLISSKTFLIISIILIISLYVYRLYRGYKIILLNHVSIFYTILYFCTFEILPLLLLYKMYGAEAG